MLTHIYSLGKSSESVLCTMLKACEKCTDMGQLWHTVPIRKTFHSLCLMMYWRYHITSI